MVYFQEEEEEEEKYFIELSQILFISQKDFSLNREKKGNIFCAFGACVYMSIRICAISI